MVGARLRSYGLQWLGFNVTVVCVETGKHGGDGSGLRCARGSGAVAVLQARWSILASMVRLSNETWCSTPLFSGDMVGVAGAAMEFAKICSSEDGGCRGRIDMLPNGAALVNGGDGAVAAGVGPNGG
ncbi:hypothetical protein DEO72_LG2g2684 [Vigna unguiculata]|uniref:Uncharacterized protein n=1 Tax=Vigna unguiculata TaxID=3917 RepID=A0A4D6L1J0_VIGUN|nr:hypothetical protein DEO72_LG2g2684 [Vigna unguiculata]